MVDDLIPRVQSLSGKRNSIFANVDLAIGVKGAVEIGLGFCVDRDVGIVNYCIPSLKAVVVEGKDVFITTDRRFGLKSIGVLQPS